MIIAVLFAGGILGSLTLRPLADKVGRKKGLMFSFLGILVSSALSIASFFVSLIKVMLLLMEIPYNVTVYLVEQC